MRWAEHKPRMGQMRNAYRILDGKPERKKTLTHSTCRWENNIKTNLKETGWESGLDSSGLGQEPLVGSCEHSPEPQSSTEVGELLEQLNDN